MLGKRDVIVHGTDPFNAETEPAASGRALITATEAFYVRMTTGRCRRRRASGGCGCKARWKRPLDLSLATLREALPEYTVTATLQCAGNRRAGLIAIRDIPGEAPWGPGATGTATWTGARLADVLGAGAAVGRGLPRGVRGRRPEPGGQAAAAVRRIDPARQGPPPRGAARVGDERGAAAAGARCPAAGRGAGLHRRAQHQVAGPDRAAPHPVGRAISRRSSTGCCPRTVRPPPAPGCRSASSR